MGKGDFMKKCTATEEEQDFIVEKYRQGLSSIKIQKLLPRLTLGMVTNTLRRKHVCMRSNKENSRRFNVNHHFFDEIDSEEKAYWLGFIAADGFVDIQNHIGLSLSVRDRSHLEKFRKAINSEYQIHDYVNHSGYKNDYHYSRLMITSEWMKNTLAKHGIVEQKTLVLKFPTTIPEELVHHFIRGYFDGDGSLSYDSIRNQYQIKIVGTKDILSNILSCFQREHLKLYKRHEEDTNTFYISIGGNNQVLSLMNLLYSDATVYLDRKYERYLGLSRQSS